MTLWKYVLILGLLLIHTTLLAAKPSKDWAVFKLGDDVYFSSDLVPLYQDFATLRCAYPDATLLKVSKLFFTKTEKELMDKTHSEGENAFLSDRKIVWAELKRLLKLSIYVSQMKVVMKEGLPKEVLALAKAENCANRGQASLKNIERLLKIEIFLKSRFNNRFYTRGNRAKGDKKENDKSAERIEDAIDTLVKTAERQVSHEDFF